MAGLGEEDEQGRWAAIKRKSMGALIRTLEIKEIRSRIFRKGRDYLQLRDNHRQAGFSRTGNTFCDGTSNMSAFLVLYYNHWLQETHPARS